MNSQVREIFTKAAVLPQEDREAYLAEACGEDSELRLEVQRLLVDAERDDSFFGEETDDATVAADGSGQPSQRKATPSSDPNPPPAENESIRVTSMACVCVRPSITIATV